MVKQNNMKTIKIDNDKIIQFVCEIAQQITEQKFGKYTYSYNKVNGSFYYQEEAQEYFNTKYDEYESILIDMLNIKPLIY